MLLLLLCVGPPAQPERAALAWLAERVPAWAKENRCRSCHHDGDGARALFGAGIRTASLDWLAKPAAWDKNGGDGPFSDKRLARLQFAAALAEAVRIGLARREPSAVKLVEAEQSKEGHWRVSGELGSPATWGDALATALSRETLARLGGSKDALARADAWLRKTKPASVLDASALLLGLGAADDAPAKRQREQCLEVLRRGERKEGGWGPWEKSPAEVFDTAVAVIALSRVPSENERMRRGRAWLLSQQGEDGAWTETTRPTGGVSYPQRASTTAWAAMALRASAPTPAPRPPPPSPGPVPPAAGTAPGRSP